MASYNFTKEEVKAAYEATLNANGVSYGEVRSAQIADDFIVPFLKVLESHHPEISILTRRMVEVSAEERQRPLDERLKIK